MNAHLPLAFLNPTFTELINAHLSLAFLNPTFTELMHGQH